jgi:hypothetical protein
MTHDIVQSDIALATRLIGNQRSDQEILQALANRGVDPLQAAKLLDDLHSGRKPEVRTSLPLEMTMTRRSRPRSSARPTDKGSSNRSQEPARRPEPPPQRPVPSTRRNVVLGKIATASFLVLAVAAVGHALLKRGPSGSVALGRTQAKPAITKQTTARQLATPTATRVAPNGKSSPLVLELQPDGLHIGGSLVSGSNLLTAFAQVLGAPTRTNQAAPAGAVIYAYDDHGLLIYSQPGGRTNHIVLDCEATGGANGTISPFVGMLKVEDQVIGPDTDSQTLAGFKNLGLDNRKSGSKIWGGHYHRLGLIFAYLRSPEQPSLIEIDLK